VEAHASQALADANQVLSYPVQHAWSVAQLCQLSLLQWPPASVSVDSVVSVVSVVTSVGSVDQAQSPVDLVVLDQSDQSDQVSAVAAVVHALHLWCALLILVLAHLDTLPVLVCVVRQFQLYKLVPVVHALVVKNALVGQSAKQVFAAAQMV